MRTEEIVLEETLRPGTTTTGKVTRIYPSGVWVQLPDGQKGFIKRRELSWAARPPHPRHIVRLGQEIPCYLLEYDEKRSRWNVSLRRALGDPWETFLKTHQVGMAIKGRVVKVMPFGLFVEIIEGVVGLIHRSDLPVDESEDLEKHFWVGDHVAAVITHIDPDRRRVSLSLRRFQALLDAQSQKEYLRRSSGVTLAERLGVSSTILKRVLHLAEEEYLQLQSPCSYTILLVEDDEDVRERIASLLKQAGHSVIEAGDRKKALEALRQHPHIDMVLLDINIPGSNGHDVAREMGNIQPALPVVLMTGMMGDNKRLEDEQAYIVGYISKPFSDHVLLKTVERAVETPEQLRTEMLQRLQSIKTYHQKPRPLLAKRSDPLTAVLTQLRSRTHAEWVGVFHFDRETRRVTLVARSGEIDVDFDTTKYELEYSPVRDVVEDKAQVFETYVSKHSAARFQKLRAAFPCESCIGVPVDVEGETTHALFLFHRSPRAFHKRDLQDARLTALRISMALEQERFERELFGFHQHFLMGQLTAGLTHEVNNKLQALLFDARSLRSDLGRMKEPPTETLEWLSFRDAMEQRVQRITDVIYGVAETVGLFRDLMRQEGQTSVDVNRIARRAATVVQVEATRSGISVEFTADASVARVQGTPVHLEQALVNVILNAVQQMSLAGRKGKVEVRTSYEPDDPDGLPVKIRVRDQGPGIHAKWFEEIFKLGFTTRTGGTGMGLYITRALVENMGGRVSVEESLIGVGSTFVIELPADNERKEDA